jgi:hypothetical protein
MCETVRPAFEAMSSKRGDGARMAAFGGLACAIPIWISKVPLQKRKKNLMGEDDYTARVFA